MKAEIIDGKLFLIMENGNRYSIESDKTKKMFPLKMMLNQDIQKYLGKYIYESLTPDEIEDYLRKRYFIFSMEDYNSWLKPFKDILIKECREVIIWAFNRMIKKIKKFTIY